MSSLNKIRVDRGDELALLDRLVDGQTTKRILLISAASGMGKSELIREFIARRAHNATLAVVDFKNGGLSLADLFSQICDTLGWSRFPTLNTTVNQIVSPLTANVSSNILIGHNQISIALNASDEPTRDSRRDALTKAFVADLRAIGRAALIFDVFEQCEPSLQKWLASVFLPFVQRSPQLVIVIAGQQVPDPPVVCECIPLPLEHIAPEHWHQYAHHLGWMVPLELIRGLCIDRPHSLRIANLIESYALAWQRRSA